MAKYINILLLFSLVCSMTIDISVVDTVDLQHHHIEDNHQELSQNADHDSNIDYHCINHTLHHGITSQVAIDNSMKKDTQTYYIYNDIDTGLHLIPATPPPLSVLS